MSGTPDRTGPGTTRSGDERRVATACGAVVRESQVLVLALVGVGSLLALTGWTAVRASGEQPTSERRDGVRSVRA